MRWLIIERLSSFRGIATIYVGALESVLYTEVSFIQSVLYQRFHCMYVLAHFDNAFHCTVFYDLFLLPPTHRRPQQTLLLRATTAARYAVETCRRKGRRWRDRGQNGTVVKLLIKDTLNKGHPCTKMFFDAPTYICITLIRREDKLSLQ